MKLYYSPGACSLSPHIVLREAGIEPTLVPVDLGAHKYGNGKDFHEINPKGYVPVLETDDGEILTEGPAIVQYIADRKPEKNLAPKAGTIDRYRLQEWLNFITSELHKGYSPLFNKAFPEDAKKMVRSRLRTRYEWVDGQLAGKDYLMGKAFSVADAYLFTVTNWAKHVGIELDDLKNVAAFMQRMVARPAVEAAMKAEKLKP